MQKRKQIRDAKTRGFPSLPNFSWDSIPPVKPTQVLGKEGQRRALQPFIVGPSMLVSGVFVVPDPSSMHIPAEKALMLCCPQKRACLVAPGGDNYFCYVALDMSSRCLDLSDCCSQ